MTISPKQIGKVIDFANFATNTLLTLPSSTESYRTINFSQTTAGRVITLPNPVDTASRFGIDITNSGSAAFTISFVGVVDPGKTVRAVWGLSGWTGPKSASAAVATLIDTALATQTVTLPAATGSGDIKFYANEAIVLAGTLAVASGEKLNGVVDGTFLFSNYPAGTQFIVTDYAAGEWVVAVEGASTQTSLTYGRAEWNSNTPSGTVFTAVSSSASNTLIAGTVSRLPFGSASKTSDGVTIDNVNSQFVVVKAGRYSISATVAPVSGTANGWLQIVKNDTTMLAVNSSYNPVVTGFKLEAATSWVGDLAVGDRVDARYGSNFAIGSANITITQLASASAVLAGMVTPEALINASGVTGVGSPVIPSTVTELSPAYIQFSAMTVLSGAPVLNPATGILTLPPGTYRIDGGIGNAESGRLAFRWYVDGVPSGAVGNIIAPSDTAGQAPPTGHAVHEFTLTSSGTVGLGVFLSSTTTAVGRRSDFPSAEPWFVLQQLPTSTVVMPDAVPVVDLKHARYYATANLPSTAYGVAPGVRLHPLFQGQEGTIPSDGQDWAINSAGRYRFDWLLLADSGQLNDDGEVHLVVNGVSVASVFYNMNQASAVNQTAGTLTADLQVNDLVGIRYAGSPTSDTIIFEKGSYVQVQQIATKSVVGVDSTIVPVIDDDTFATATATNVPSAESVKTYIASRLGATSVVASVLWAGNNGLPSGVTQVDTPGSLSFYYSSTAVGGQFAAHNKTAGALNIQWFGTHIAIGGVNALGNNGAALAANGNISLGTLAVVADSVQERYLTLDNGEAYKITLMTNYAANGYKLHIQYMP